MGQDARFGGVGRGQGWQRQVQAPDLHAPGIQAGEEEPASVGAGRGVPCGGGGAGEALGGLEDPARSCALVGNPHQVPDAVEVAGRQDLPPGLVHEGPARGLPRQGHGLAIPFQQPPAVPMHRVKRSPAGRRHRGRGQVQPAFRLPERGLAVQHAFGVAVLELEPDGVVIHPLRPLGDLPVQGGKAGQTLGDVELGRGVLHLVEGVRDDFWRSLRRRGQGPDGQLALAGALEPGQKAGAVGTDGQVRDAALRAQPEFPLAQALGPDAALHLQGVVGGFRLEPLVPVQRREAEGGPEGRLEAQAPPGGQMLPEPLEDVLLGWALALEPLQVGRARQVGHVAAQEGPGAVQLVVGGQLAHQGPLAQDGRPQGAVGAAGTGEPSLDQGGVALDDPAGGLEGHGPEGQLERGRPSPLGPARPQEVVDVGELMGEQQVRPAGHAGAVKIVAEGRGAPEDHERPGHEWDRLAIGLLLGIRQDHLDHLGALVAHGGGDQGMDTLDAPGHLLGPVRQQGRVVDTVVGGGEGAPVGPGPLYGRCARLDGGRRQQAEKAQGLAAHHGTWIRGGEGVTNPG